MEPCTGHVGVLVREVREVRGGLQLTLVTSFGVFKVSMDVFHEFNREGVFLFYNSPKTSEHAKLCATLD
jgi:hypothetical protein